MAALFSSVKISCDATHESSMSHLKGGETIAQG